MIVKHKINLANLYSFTKIVFSFAAYDYIMQLHVLHVSYNREFASACTANHNALRLDKKLCILISMENKENTIYKCNDVNNDNVSTYIKAFNYTMNTQNSCISIETEYAKHY